MDSARISTRARRGRAALVAVLGAATVLAAPLAGTADAKKKRKSYAGSFSGPTEYFGSVSFRLTRSGKVLNFKLTDATFYCRVNGSSVETEKTGTITHGPMQMQKVNHIYPNGKKFDLEDPFSEAVASACRYFKGGVVDLTSGPDGGRVYEGTKGFNGETSFLTSTGPYNAPGTEVCGTKIIDWEAKRPGDKGFVAVGNSGHLRPPLSEFAFLD